MPEVADHLGAPYQQNLADYNAQAGPATATPVNEISYTFNTTYQQNTFIYAEEGAQVTNIQGDGNTVSQTEIDQDFDVDIDYGQAGPDAGGETPPLEDDFGTQDIPPGDEPPPARRPPTRPPTSTTPTPAQSRAAPGGGRGRRSAVRWRPGTSTSSCAGMRAPTPGTPTSASSLIPAAAPPTGVAAKNPRPRGARRW